MKADEQEINALIKALCSRHSSRFDGFVKQAKKLATYIKELTDFKLIGTNQSVDIPHVGRVIVDAVLQVGHDYEKQVRKRVECIQNYHEAATVSGFLRIIKELGVNKLLNWNSPDMEKDLLAVGNFFANRGIDTYSELREWLKSEDNRDSLLSDRSELGSHKPFRLGDKTADYFRVLVGHWDAVAVDANIKAILEKVDLTSNHNYKEMRAVFQLAALDMGLRPIDLDSSLYDDSVVHPERYKSGKKRTAHHSDAQPRKTGIKNGRTIETGSMPKKGDIFQGKINDLSQSDAEGWKRRDIWFFKHELNKREKFEYPTRNDQITLIEPDGNRYEMNFSKPDFEDKVCLGTPSRLKTWYRKKGFADEVVRPNDKVYFEYTGCGAEFIVLTEQEYRSKHKR